MTTPWEVYPKSIFDNLLDIIVSLPGLLDRADRIFPSDPTLQRRMMAQELLGNFLNMERRFEAWYRSINPESSGTPVYGPVASEGDVQIPFIETFTFRDHLTAFSMIYYWTSMILLYPCIERLHHAIFQPVVDAFPQVQPRLPRGLSIEPLKYGPRAVRELAANVCSSLDYALSHVQPDMLVVPLFVVCELYRAINESAAGDGQLEIMWCEGFRVRLALRGQEIAEVITGKKWQEISTH
jgi:hypothetical protein